MNNIALIGLGKLGSHLSHYLNLKKIDHVVFKRHSDISKLKNFQIVLLCLPDDQLEKFYESNYSDHQTWIHFSGSFYHDKMIGLHPMMSFSSELFDLDFYENLTWMLDQPIDISAHLPLEFMNIHYIQPANKAHYHALCVMAGNIPQLICEQTESELMKLGINEKAIKNYIKTAFDNYLLDRPATGPIVRNDQKTIEQNLKNLPEYSQHIYQAVKDNYNEDYQ